MNGTFLALLLWLTTPAGSESALASAGGNRWTDPPPEIVPSDAELVARGAVIGDIVVIAGDIFDPDDPEEDRLLFRVANRLHRSTRPSVVESQLLFAEGDAYDPRVLAETERLLRSNRYLFDADIKPVRVRDNRVDVEVRTRDVWTLSGGIVVNRSGGENSTRFELQDVGFLGTGKDVTIQQESDVDRTSTLLRYRDPAIRGTRWNLEAVYADNSDGFHRKLYLERPFFALESRWAVSMRSIFEERVDRLYSHGKVRQQLGHERDWVEVWAGRSPGLHEGAVRRWTLGATYAHDVFGPPDKIGGGDGVDLPDFDDPWAAFGTDERWASRQGRGADDEKGAPVGIGEDRKLLIPWIGFEWIADDFVEAQDVDRIGRTEDRALGGRVSLRLGATSTGIGSDRDAIVFQGLYRDAFGVGRNQLVELDTRVAGRYRTDEAWLEGFLASTAVRYTRRNLGKHLFVARLGADWAERLDSERQLLLGGDSGLRGYPLRYQEGDRRLLLTLEQRFFTDWQILKLVGVGGAIFADVGRAWFADEDAPDARWLSNVGVGLRLASNRARGTIVHLDVAFPLASEGDLDGVQWLITTHDTF